MKEDFLHYLWRYQKFSFPPLETVCGKAITVVAVGHPNTGSGPDFLEAQITIGALRFVGAVEIHLHSSHWYQHGHQTDKAYDTVILHVVWQHDVPVFLPSGGTLPTLELSRYAHPKLIDFYTRHFLTQKKALPCVPFLSDALLSKWTHWRERVYLERLETRLVVIQERLAQLENNWEALLFERMARSFGLKRNGDTFEAVAQSIPYSVIRKIRANPVDLEALFLGHCGLLTEAHDPIPYSKNLRERYRYLCQKFQLSPPIGLAVQFGGLRPYNFPTIRLSQLAQLMHHYPALLEQLYQSKQLRGLDLLRAVGVSEFWKTHFSFSTTTPSKQVARDKKLSESFRALVLINTVIPVLYAYAKWQGQDRSEWLFQQLEALASEKNSLVDFYEALGFPLQNALDSQALLQLEYAYCLPRQCLKCAVGFSILKETS